MMFFVYMGLVHLKDMEKFPLFFQIFRVHEIICQCVLFEEIIK